MKTNNDIIIDNNEYEFEKNFVMKDEYDFSNGVRGKHYKPIKKTVTMRLDSILVEYYKDLASSQGIGYQTLINATLNKVMQEQLKNAQ